MSTSLDSSLSSLSALGAGAAVAALPARVRERVQAGLQALRQQAMVLVHDDLEREDEVDLIAVAEHMTVPQMAQMIRDGSGIVCVCMPQADADLLGLAPMVARNRSRQGTAFTVSVEATTGVTTGVSATDRLTTIRAALAGVQTRDAGRLVSPGHVFPLVARPGGVLERRGHTEASVDLARLAGCAPMAVLCELMNPDGTMMRGAQVRDYAAQHGLCQLSVAELAQYRAALEADARGARQGRSTPVPADEACTAC